MTVDLDALRKETEELLHSRGVFDVDNFGWLNADDVDPEFVGYAMWTLSSPYDYDDEGWQNDTPPNRAPTQIVNGIHMNICGRRPIMNHFGSGAIAAMFGGATS